MEGLAMLLATFGSGGSNGLKRGGRNRTALAVLITLCLSAIIVGTSPALAGTPFEQDQRANDLTLQGGTDTFAAKNAFGGAFGSTTLSNLQTGIITPRVKDGSISWLLEMPHLSDLSGTTSDPFSLGFVNGAPYLPAGNPRTYDGSADTDWWYGGLQSEVSADGEALHQLPASFASGTLTAGPGTVKLDNVLAGASWAMSSTRIQAQSSSSSQPFQSTNGFPPGYLPADGLSPGPTSFTAMTGGGLAGDISAGSLAATPVPAAMTAGGSAACNENYTSDSTMLDVLVAGCTHTAGPFTVTEVNPTQPDSTLSPGDTYVFTTTGTPKHVTGCKKNGVTATLPDCLAAAGYSAYFTFTTDRVIVRKPCAPGSYSDTGVTPCKLAAPGFFASGYGSTKQTACPAGRTSRVGSSSCPIHVRRTLSVDKRGSGKGKVTSQPAGI